MNPLCVQKPEEQISMEDNKKANLILLLLIIFLITLLIVARIVLKLTNAFFLICGIDVSLTAAILAYMIIRSRFNRRRNQIVSQLVSEGRELRIEYSFLRKVAGVPTKFRYKELEEATDYFRSVIGKGSSGSVFKGVLKDGTAVAVKRIECEIRGEKEFRAEVSAIASVQHTNLVRLIGYCTNSSGPRFLVYEFVSNGSLNRWIFPRNPNSNPRFVKQNRSGVSGGCLAWDLRFRVAIDVAKALAYLHHDCRSRILHLDVKPENILLDENYRAIVSDFGLSKLMSKEESRIMTSMRGTKGYLAPEWLLENGISEKSDVFSYGMVVLELIGGRRSVSVVDSGEDRSKRKWQYYPRILSAKMKEGKLMEAIDQRLLETGSGSGSIDEKEVRNLVCVGLWCIQEKARLRPAMATVVDLLEGRVAVEEPPETEMLVVDLLAVDEETMDGRDRPVKVAAFGERMNSRDLATSSSTFSYAFSAVSARKQIKWQLIHNNNNNIYDIVIAKAAINPFSFLASPPRISSQAISLAGRSLDRSYRTAKMSFVGSSVASAGNSSRKATEFGKTYVVRPKGRHQATVVWLHGLGDDGSSWSQLLETLPLSNIKWICPTAPTRPIALFGGFPSTAWFDVEDLSENGPEDLEGLDASAAHVAYLLSKEPADVKLGVGGFSMGAATALYSATCHSLGKYGNGSPYPANLSAVIGLSGWLPCSKTLKNKMEEMKASNSGAGSLPILLCHGKVDDVVLYKFGEKSSEALHSSGFQDVTFKSYNTLGHYTVPEEMDEVCAWLTSKLGL